jgi:hypothetical protein
MLREGKVADNAQAGSGKIPDPRRFVFVEACSDLENAALSFGVRLPGSKRLRPYRPFDPSTHSGLSRAASRDDKLRVAEDREILAGEVSASRWYDSDRGREQFRIVRAGCFRGAVPLPRGAAMPDAIRFRAWRHSTARGTPPGQPASVRITRVNGVFMLADDFVPKPSRFSWTGSLLVKTDGTPTEFRIQN